MAGPAVVAAGARAGPRRARWSPGPVEAVGGLGAAGWDGGMAERGLFERALGLQWPWRVNRRGGRGSIACRAGLQAVQSLPQPGGPAPRRRHHRCTHTAGPGLTHRRAPWVNSSHDDRTSERTTRCLLPYPGEDNPDSHHSTPSSRYIGTVESVDVTTRHQGPVGFAMMTSQQHTDKRKRERRHPAGSGPFPTLQIGDQVRISGKSVREVVGVENSGLQLLDSGFVPYSEMTELEIRTGSRSRWKGGLVAGVALVLAYALTLFLTPNDPGGYGDLAGILAILFGCPAGAALGAIVGAFVRTDVWKIVKPEFSEPA